MIFIFILIFLSSAFSQELSHVGCFYNTSEIIMSTSHKSEKMSLDLCHKKCKEFNEDYIILSGGDMCHCGNSNFEPANDCSYLCGEDKCGGDNSVDVYRINNEYTSVEYEYMDCFLDKKEEERVMDYFVVIEDLTREKCRLHCSSIRNSMYYALQYGTECFCGTSDVFSDYDIYGPGVCDMECEGNPDEICGGFYAFSLFRFIPCDESTNVPDAVIETESPVETEVPIETESLKLKYPLKLNHPLKLKYPSKL